MPRAGLASIVFGLAIALSCLPGWCAGGRVPIIAPYQPVAVHLPAAPGDPAYAAFRQMLATLAQRRAFGDLARYVTAQGFFWAHDSSGRFDPKRSGAENLAAALGLDRNADAGWQMLADLAAEPTASTSPAEPDVLCAPGRPDFDRNDFDNLIAATHFVAADWFYTRVAGVQLRAAPRPDGAVAETLGGYFVRLLRFVTTPANADPLHTAWARIAAPSGRVGYVAPDSLSSLAAPQLCYAKDVGGRWTIAGFIGGGT